MSFLHAVADRERIEQQLGRLAARADGRRMETLVQDGVRFSQLLDERADVVKLLSRALGDASYRPGVAGVARVVLGNKPREIARVGALELVAHAVVGDVLARAIEPKLSPNLWSYRSGRSSWQALRGVARYVAKHRRAHADPRARGLYVLRSDVRAYTDEIPVGDDAPLWRELDDALALDARSAAMVRALVRPEVTGADGNVRRLDRGVLFGLPTTTAIANLYLTPLDRALERLDGLYARFGDDVLFASARPDVVREAHAALERILVDRGLAVNSKKLRILYWNGAGRPSTAWPDATPSATVAFLGGALRFDGTIALSDAKWKTMLRDLRTRIRDTARLAREMNADERARLLATIVNDAFDVRSNLSLAHAPLVADLVSDRRQLAQLDHLVALWIAEAATEGHGPRAFRDLSPRALRTRAGLISRVVARNRAGRH
jgi:hypothetical protein